MQPCSIHHSSCLWKAIALKRIVILGSTGSVGKQTLDVIKSQPDDFAVLGLAAGENAELLAQQVSVFKPKFACLHSGVAGCEDMFSSTLLEGSDGLVELAAHPSADLVVVAIPGIASLEPTLAAIQAGKTVALASKEALFVAGELIMQQARTYGVSIIPVDSEPSAIWQCLLGEIATRGEGSQWIHDVLAGAPVNRIILTASGGPFRDLGYDQLNQVTPDMALNHPTWRMGMRPTIDSATMLNKGMEVVETHWLFGVDWSKIEAVIHPQSIVHSLVEFIDGSVKAQLSQPDMRLFIQYALNCMNRTQGIVERLNLCKIASLTFEPIDFKKYTCFSLAIEAAKAGGTYAAVVNAADEELIRLFVQERIRFDHIPRLIGKVLDMHNRQDIATLRDVEAADEWSRNKIGELTGAIA